MPARYFQTDGANDDRRLLPSHLRADQELPELAEVIEAEIVAHFTRSLYHAPAYAPTLQVGAPGVLEFGALAGCYSLGDGRYVCLKGYHDDAAQADAALADALKREIVAVLRWRLGLQRRTPGVTSESDGEKSRSFTDAAANHEPFPAHFPMHLRPFVVAPVAWSL